MPFKSKAQRRWMYANDPEMAARWEAETKGDLPERSKKKVMTNPMRRFLQQGGSIVDYLKGQNTDYSKEARRKLAQARGLKGDFSAEDNLALLASLQNNPFNESLSTELVNTQDVGPDGRPITVRTQQPYVEIGDDASMIPVRTGDASMPIQRVATAASAAPVPTSVRGTSNRVSSRRVSPIVPVVPTTNVTPQQVVNPSAQQASNNFFAQDATKRLNMFRDQGVPTNMPSKNLPNVTVNSYTGKIPNYSRTNRNNLGFWDSLTTGTTDQIDFNALRNIDKAIKAGKGNVILSNGQRKDFGSLTSEEKKKLQREVDTYRESYKF